MNSIVQCSCGSKLRLPSGLQRSSVRCPKCKSVVPVRTITAPVEHSVVTTEAPGNPTCPICLTEFHEAEPRRRCPECQQLHHEECWTEVGGCATYGCQQAAATEPSEAGAGRPQSAWGDTKKCPVCGETIKAIDLQCRYCDTAFSSVDPMSVIDLRRQAETKQQISRLKKRIAMLFGVSLLGLLAPLVLVVATAFFVPQRLKVARCGPLFVMMGWTSVALSALYTVLILLFLLL